jgi:hypothetical protein
LTTLADSNFGECAWHGFFSFLKLHRRGQQTASIRQQPLKGFVVVGRSRLVIALGIPHCR